MTITSLRMWGSFMYLPFLQKTCSSGMQLTMKSDGKFYAHHACLPFSVVPVESETSSCLVPITLIILKLDMYLLSQFYFYQNF